MASEAERGTVKQVEGDPMTRAQLIAKIEAWLEQQAASDSWMVRHSVAVSLLRACLPLLQEQEQDQVTRVDEGQPRRIAPTGSTAATDGGNQ